jgi:tellurite resistance protein
MTQRAPLASVQHLGFAWFAMVMGLCGLSLAWFRAVPHWGAVALLVSLGLGVLAAVVFVVLTGAKLWRWYRFPAAVLEDASHPLRHVFVATLPSSVVLLPTIWVAHRGYSLWAELVWMLGAVGLLLGTVGVIWRWLQPAMTAEDFWRGMTPALFIPVVGNVLPALAGVTLGHPVWAAAQYGVAIFLWPIALVLVLARIGMVGLWPARMMPTTFVTMAPPSILALSGHQLGAPDTVVHMLWGVSLFFTLVSLTVLKRCLQQAFGMPFWGMSFPLAASAALSLHLAPTQGWVHVLAMAWLVCVSGVIGALLLATVRGLWRGVLLVAEAPAPSPSRT